MDKLQSVNINVDFKSLPKPDARWEACYGLASYREYLSCITERIYLKPEVEENVRGMFALAQSLIDLAYYQYEFLDLASFQALRAFELALTKRIDELEPAHREKKTTMKDLIDWFCERGHFETDNSDYLHQIREIRNGFAHPKFHSFGGPMTSWPVNAAACLVNDLYEDIGLRTARMVESKQINTRLSEIMKSGAILTDENGKQFYIYLCTVGFINNKHRRKTYTLLYKPIFELPRNYTAQDSTPVYPVFHLTCKVIEMAAPKITGYDVDGNHQFTISAPSNDIQRQYLINWHREFAAYNQALPFFSIGDDSNVSNAMSKLLLDSYRAVNEQ